VIRRYRQGRRAETAEETRRRIVQATFDLHAEQGVAATTMKQIAARARVSVGTVYHHFPTYDDAITACGAHASALFPTPTEALFDGAADRAERVRRLAQALFTAFAGMRAFGSVLADQDRLPILRAFVDQEQAARLALCRAAAGEGPANTLAALVDHGSWDAFARLGFTPQAAAERVAEVAEAWLATLPPEETP
jgi:AcrR family transcriptional regulator